ncbi:MAG: hypothetical protein R2713_23680 [Ilumatobacteraceae bacterium]
MRRATLRRLHDLRYWLYLGACWAPRGCSRAAASTSPPTGCWCRSTTTGLRGAPAAAATTRALLTRDGADEVGGAPDDRERVVALALAGLTELAGR